MEQPQGDSEADILQKLEGFFQPEQAAPVDDEPVAEASEQEVEGDEQPQEIEAVEAEDPGLVELEIEDGQTYRVPQALKDGYLRQSDYTRKTQELASLQRQAQAAIAQQNAIAKFQEQTQDDQQKLSQAKAELQRFKQIDWTNLDTETYIKTRGYVDQLKEQVTEIEQGLNGKAQKVQQELQQHRRQAAQSAYDYIQRHVKDWQPDSQTEREVAKYAGNYGIPPEAMAEVAVMFPGFAVLAHKAAQYDKVVSSKGQAVQKAQKAPPVIKPGATTSTNTASAQKSRDLQGRFLKSGSTDDFARLLLAKGMVK